jgi:hypothetical protein
MNPIYHSLFYNVLLHKITLCVHTLILYISVYVAVELHSEICFGACSREISVTSSETEPETLPCKGVQVLLQTW